MINWVPSSRLDPWLLVFCPVLGNAHDFFHKKSETVCEKNNPFAGKSSFGAVHPWNYPKLYNPSTKA
jgi:hypothetical protein